MERILGAFDFDYTVVTENSDAVARDLLAPEVIQDRLKAFKSSKGWTNYMQEIFQLLFEEGVSIDKIRESIISIPPVPDFVKLFKDLKTIDCDIVLISDSNTFFIEEWLKSNEIRETVHTIYSNPARISNGKLDVQPYHEQDYCKLSTRNLCKGQILLSHIEDEEAKGNTKYRKIIYVGDGHNDLCPSLKLVEGSYVFPRKGFPLVEELRSAGRQLKAEVIPWETTDQIWSVVKNL